MMFSHLEISDMAQDLAMHDALTFGARAFKAQGMKAFENTQSATRHHEAGHAVIYAATGYPPKSVLIKAEADGSWSGMTLFPDNHPGKTDLDIRIFPDEGINLAACVVAGWAGEKVCEGPNFCWGSSIDELVQFKTMAHMIAVHHDLPSMLPIAIMETVMSILVQERAIVESIAKSLRSEHRIRGPKLLKLLDGVQKRDIPAMVKAML